MPNVIYVPVSFSDLTGPGAMTAQAGVLVAAADAPAAVRAKADYTCDGNADDVQIQEVIDALESSGGGTVCLSEGTFHLSTPLVLKNGVSLIGAHYPKLYHAEEVLNPDLHIEYAGGSRLMATDIAALTTQDRTSGLEIANLVIDGDLGSGSGGCEYGIYSGAENEDGLGPCVIRNVFVLNCRTAAFYLCNPSHVRMDHCWAWNVYRGWHMLAWHAGGDQPANCLITDCYTYLCNDGQLDANHWNKAAVDGGAWLEARKAVPTGGHDLLSYLNFITMVRFQVNGFNQTGHTLMKVSGEAGGSVPTGIIFYDLDLEGGSATWALDMSYTTRVEIGVAAAHAPLRFTHCDGVGLRNVDRGVHVTCDQWTADRSTAFGYIYEPGTYSMPGAWRRGDNGTLQVGGNPTKMSSFNTADGRWLEVLGRVYLKEALGPVYASSAEIISLNAEETSGLVLCTRTDDQLVKLSCGVENPGARVTITKAAAGGTVKVAAVAAGSGDWTCYLDGVLCEANGNGWNTEMVHQWDSMTFERADLGANLNWLSSSRKLLTILGANVQAVSVGANAGVIPSTGVAAAHLASSPAFPRSALATDQSAADVIPLQTMLTGNCIPIGAWWAVQEDYRTDQATSFDWIVPDSKSLYVQTHNPNEASYLLFERGLPDNYLAGGAIQVLVRAKASSGSAGAVDVEVWKLTDGAGGSDLCTTAAQSITTSWGDYAFTVNPSGLAPGDLLLVRITGNGGSGAYCQVERIGLRRDVKG